MSRVVIQISPVNKLLGNDDITLQSIDSIYKGLPSVSNIPIHTHTHTHGWFINHLPSLNANDWWCRILVSMIFLMPIIIITQWLNGRFPFERRLKKINSLLKCLHIMSDPVLVEFPGGNSCINWYDSWRKWNWSLYINIYDHSVPCKSSPLWALWDLALVQWWCS